MLTNIFRLGGLRQLSWFQFVATDTDIASTDRWLDVQHTNDVLSAHIRLQNEGHLSAWTRSGTSGSSPGGHVLRLWLFIPGRNETINAAIQAIINDLKVVDSGVWCYPKVRNEVSYALCEALKNRLERGLRTVGYMRFGDTFVKCKSFSVNDPQLRRLLPACEAIFTVSEEAIFVHFILQKKRVRLLCVDDIQTTLKQQSYKCNDTVNLQEVVVAPNGLSGKLTGCYSSQLIHVLYESRRKAMGERFEESIDSTSYSHSISSVCGLHAEVRFGQSSYDLNKYLNMKKKTLEIASCKEDDSCRKLDSDFSCSLFYPPSAVLVPVIPALPSKLFLKRCWLQRWAGASWMEDEILVGSNVNKHASRRKLSDGSLGSAHPSVDASFANKGLSSKSSSSNSSTSGGSSLDDSSSHGSSTSDTDGEGGGAPGELDADAESLASKRKQNNPLSGKMIDDDMKEFEEADITKWVQSIGTTQNEAPILNSTNKSLSSVGELLNDISQPQQERPDTRVSGMVNVALGTPKAATSQAGTPWDWPDDDRGLNIENDADILAEFGDFGDFFEDEFGEPPGTAESDALMFPLTDCIDGLNSPGNACLDFSDPMLLPILDIPTLEGLEQPPAPKDVKVSGVSPGNQELHEPAMKTPDVTLENVNIVDSLPKSEAVLLLAPGYEPVTLPNGHSNGQSIFKNIYVPTLKKFQSDVTSPDIYIYSATPPPSPKIQGFERKREHYDVFSERAVFFSKRIKTSDTHDNHTAEKSSASRLTVPNVKSGHEKPVSLGMKMPILDNALSTYTNYSGEWTWKKRFPTMMLATERDCFFIQLCFLQLRTTETSSITGSIKEAQSDPVAASDSNILNPKGVVPNQQERKKKDRIPSRIAGDLDEDVHDAPQLSHVGIGVWRPVGAPKPQKVPSNSADISTAMTQDTSAWTSKMHNWQDFLNALPLLIQQATVTFDSAFDGEFGEGPYGWLTFQEQDRRKSVCGPGGIHARCGGMFCASHFLDNAGVELLDPFATEISAASAASILQSDARIAMATAFGDAYLDGPLSLGEWLRGRAFLNESNGTDNAPSDSKEKGSTVITGIGEPITPPQCTTGSSSMKLSVQDVENQPSDSGNRRTGTWNMEGSSLTDDGGSRRGQESGSIETDTQPNSNRNGPTIMALPMPSFLVGYQDDWLKVSSSTLHLWEKAPFEPYATTKPVMYYVLCPRIDTLLSATADYLQQLSCVYEACRLGTHVAGNMVLGHGSLPSASGKHMFSGFVPVDFPSQPFSPQEKLPSLCPLTNYASSFGKIWNCDEFLKSVGKTCKSLPVSLATAVQREPENGPSLVYYVICPSSEPDAVLQTMFIACQSIGYNIMISEKQNKLNMSNQMQRTSTFTDDLSSVKSQGIVGFSTSKLVLQVLTAETILKSCKRGSVDTDSLKEVAFNVYNKIRRIPRLSNVSEMSGRNRSLSYQNSISGVWKESSGRTPGALSGHESLLDSSAFRPNNWDSPWQQQATSNELNILENPMYLQDNLRYLFEPLFILAEPGSMNGGIGFSLSRFDESSVNIHSGPSETVHGVIADSGPDYELKSGSQKVANLHCCYGWTEDWQWLLSVWTDARGELLDVHLFPVSDGGAVGRFEAKGLHNLFVQVLLHGCQLMSIAASAGSIKPRALIISRIGLFFEIECQEWQKAVFTVGGSEVRKWPVQIWQQSDGNIVGSNSSLQPQEVSALGDRSMGLTTGVPSSPSRASSVFMSRNKSSGSSFIKSELGSSALRKQVLGQNDTLRGAFHLVQSISFVGVMLDHSLQMMGFMDTGSQSSNAIGGPQGVASTNWSNTSTANVLGSLGTGIASVKTLSTAAASYMFVPVHGLRFMSNFPLQLPSDVTAESPAIEQLLHCSGIAATSTSAFVISKAVPSIRTNLMHGNSDEWPSSLFIGLFGHMSSFVSPVMQQHSAANSSAEADAMLKEKLNKSTEGGPDHATDAQVAVEVIAAELQALSWLTVSPTCPLRRSALPFHCEVVQRLSRLLYYANSEAVTAKS